MPITVRATIFISSTPEAITGVVLDPDKAVLWTSGLERFEVVLGVPGQVGSTGRLHYLEGNQRYVMEDQLLEVQPYRRYLSRVTGDALVAEVETILTPSEHGTDVAVRWTGVGRSRLSRLMLPFMRRSIARQAQRDLEKLKRLVEGGAEATA